jgi:ABC-type bacteriocin/lantibiotic exporter with double-glycine peptidase domain
MIKINPNMYIDYFLHLEDDDLISVKKTESGSIFFVDKSDSVIIITYKEKEVTELVLNNFLILEKKDLEHRKKELNEKITWFLTKSKHRVKLLF